MMRTLITHVLVVFCSGALVLSGCAETASTKEVSAPPAGDHGAGTAAGRLSGGAVTREALVDAFLQAIERKDADALRALRVDAAEYRDVIVPGNVAPGDPPQRSRPDVVQYFWEALDTKSTLMTVALLHEHGGKPHRLVAVRDEGVRRYDGFTAHLRLRIDVEDAAGVRHELATGSVAERDGVFKFISYQRD